MSGGVDSSVTAHLLEDTGWDVLGIALATREEVMTRTIAVEKVNIFDPEAVACGQRVYGKIRSYGEPKPCVIADVGHDQIMVRFAEPQFAPCPGQRLVLYDEEDNLIGGGTITAS